MSDTAEAGARQKLKALPDGKFRAVVFNDAIGWTPALVRACYLTLTTRDGHVTFDFHGTSPENPSSYNVHPQAVVGHIANFMYEYIFHDLPICSSTFAPIDFVFPENAIVNPGPIAATSCCVFIGMQARCATHSAFAKMTYSNAIALAANRRASRQPAHFANLRRPLAVESRLRRCPLLFAQHARPGRPLGDDGMDAYGFAWCAFGRAPDSEQVESELPITVTLAQHWKDSSGAGKNRGGSGATQHWMVHKVPGIVSMCMGNGSKVPLGQPLFGGYASSPIPGITIRKTDLLKQMNEGDAHLSMDHREIMEQGTIHGNWNYELIARTPKVYEEGDLLFGFSGGGPGYGDPLERDPAAVMEDLKKNIVSEWTARQMYRVAYDAERRKVDPGKRKSCATRSAARGCNAENPTTRFTKNGARRSRRKKSCNTTARGPMPSR